jgi:hypothetical protein
MSYWEQLRDAPAFGKEWWSPTKDALVCRHMGDPNATVELETDQRRERATRVLLSLGELKR